jgi:sphingomyelin phosphodiesterase
MYQLADLHIDLRYEEGGKRSDCGDIMCCRGKPAKNPADRAGKWGDYNCDLPIETLKQIHLTNSDPDPDFIIWTGDNVAHDVLKSPFESANATLLITEYIKEHYEDTIVYPIQGNHEFSPMNLQDLNEKSNVVIDMISNVWRDWLPEESFKEYRAKSYYQSVASEHPLASDDLQWKMNGTRILALNLQSCYFFNFYLFSSLGDELWQLEWLEDTLRDMEKNDEKAIIIAHIPPGAHDCMDSFAWWYQVLADWFQHVIWTSMFGHVHAEYFNVARAVKSGKPINHDIISGSATTFTDKNPSYRVIVLDQ